MSALPRWLAFACAAAGCNQILGVEDPPGVLVTTAPHQVGGKVQERYLDPNDAVQYRPAPDATVELEAGGSVYATTVTSVAGEYLLTLPAGSPADVVIRARRAGDLEMAVFPAAPVLADLTMSFNLYTPDSLVKLAAAAQVAHAPTDRYLVVAVSDVVGPVAEATVSSTSGTARYADAQSVVVPTLPRTTTSGLAGVFAITAPIVTVSASTAARHSPPREIEIQPALTGLLRIQLD